jgi:hypothetical protein
MGGHKISGRVAIEDPDGSREDGDEFASTDEVYEALAALRDEEVAHLRAVAESRMRGYENGQLRGNEWKDLVNEATARTLTGARKWRKSNLLVDHLFGVMRSVASHWDEDAERDPAIPASQVIRTNDAGEEVDPFLAVPSAAPDPERIASSRESVLLLKEHFKDDLEVSLIIDAIGDGHKVAELPSLLEISKKTCDAAMKRLHRGKRQMKKGEEVR